MPTIGLPSYGFGVFRQVYFLNEIHLFLKNCKVGDPAVLFREKTHNRCLHESVFKINF